jgi:hypothetical protein
LNRRARGRGDGLMLKYSHPTLAFVLQYWPVTVFLPAILLLIAVLAVITRRWDAHDAAAAQQKARQAQRSVNAAEVDHRPGPGAAAA